MTIDNIPNPLINEISSTIVDIYPNPIIVLDTTGVIIWCNKATNELFKLSDNELQGKQILHLSVISDIEKPRYVKMLAELLQGEEPTDFLTYLPLPDGNEYEFHVSANLLIRNDETRVILLTLRNWKIFSVSTKEAGVTSSQPHNLDLLRTIVDLGYGGILVVGSESKVLYANEKFVSMWNIPEVLMKTRDDSKLLEHVLGQLVNPKKFLDKVKELYSSNEYNHEFIELKDGRIFERISHPVSKNIQIDGRIWRFRDVTEEQIAKHSMKASDQRYRELMENVPGGVAIADNDNRFIYVNPAFLRILKYEKDEILGMSVFDTIIPEHHNKIKDESSKRIDGVSSSYDVIMLTKYGERIITSLSAVPHRDDNGLVIGSIGLFIDNTERNLALDALSKSEQHYRELISQLPVGVALVTPDERLELVNDALATILGVPLDELHMKRFTDFMNPHDTEKIKQQTESRRLGLSSVYEVDITQPSGRKRTIRISAAPNKNENDEVVGTLGIMEDITIQKRNEQIRLLQEKEIELYETLLMHDLRNDLAIVVSYVEAVQLITQLDDEPAVFMKSAVATIMRISNLLSGFGRPQELKERNLLQYLQLLADEAVGAYEKLTMNIESTENAYDVNIAAGTLLSLVFQNLIRNTVQHVEDSPEIAIDIKRSHNMAQIIIQDNGNGIPPHIRSQLFQRGVSTKGESGGLGLHLCKEILKSKGGTIELLPPQDGRGAAFLIEIPILS